MYPSCPQLMSLHILSHVGRTMHGCMLPFVYSNSHLSPPPHHHHCHSSLPIATHRNSTMACTTCSASAASQKNATQVQSPPSKSCKWAILGTATKTQCKKPKPTIMVEQELGGSKGKGGKVGVKKGPKSAQTRCVIIQCTDIYYADLPPLVNRKTSAAKATEAASTDASGPPDHLTL